jgi:hypothetical protein
MKMGSDSFRLAALQTSDAAASFSHSRYGVEFEIPSVLVWGESIRSFDALGVPIISPGLITGTLVEVDSVGGEEDEVPLAIIMIDRHILRVEVSGKVPSDAIGKPVQFEAHDLAVYDTNY